MHDELIAQFTDAYQRYGASVLRHCRFQMSDSERAKEVTQEAFLRMWEYLQAGNRVEHMKTFLYRIANNLIVDDVRRRKGKEQLSLDELQEKGYDPGYDDIDQVHRKVDVWRTLLHVQQKEYTLLKMRYLDGLRPTDIAHKTGLAPNTVAVRLHRTIKDLADKILRKRKAISSAAKRNAKTPNR